MRPARRVPRLGAALLLGACLGLVLAHPLRAQAAGWEYQGLEVTRVALDSLRARYEGVAASPAYSERLRSQAQASADQIKTRLTEGDFRTGDRIVLRVTGEQQRSDTMVVESGRTISLPGMGAISLAGVLRSELQPHLTREIGRFIHDPQVQSEALVRLSVQGSVGRPGFYVVPATALLDDVIMMAGGPIGDVNLDQMRVERAGVPLVEGVELREALRIGRSLDQLNVLAGDEIFLPKKGAGSIWLQAGRYAAIIASTLLLGVRIF